MTKTKIWLIVAAALSVLGIIIFVGVMAVNNWNVGVLSTEKFVTNTYDITAEFSDINISVRTAEVEILPSEDGKCKVVCNEHQKVTHSVEVSGGTLNISINDTRKWYDHIQMLSLGKEKITIYLPEAEYGKLKLRGSTGAVHTAKDFTFDSISVLLSTGKSEILSSAKGLIEVEADTGDIKIADLSARELALSVSTGKIGVSNVKIAEDVEISVSTGDAVLSDLTCRNLSSDGSTGDITLENVVASEKFSIKRDTGDVRFEDADAAEIEVETDTGSVSGSLRSEKIIFATSDTGKIDVPKSTTGGRCEITTDTGNIKIEIK